MRLSSFLFHVIDPICVNSQPSRLAYLHEGLDPKVVHRDVKSSNILLDCQWSPKMSDFGLAKLLCSERSYVTTRVMGTFGYACIPLALCRLSFLFWDSDMLVWRNNICCCPFSYVAPEYACTGMLNEKSDIYSFGILIMEIITGRSPVDFSRPKSEVGDLEFLIT